MRLDAHVHVWADPAQRGRYPVYGQLIGQSAPQEPPGSAEDVLAAMDEAGVAAALVVQPGNHL